MLNHVKLLHISAVDEFFLQSNAPEMSRASPHFTGTSQRIILLQNPWNIWPPARITPVPKKGTQPVLPQNKHPIVGCLGAAAWFFSLMSWACLPGKQCSSGLRSGTTGWPGVHGQSWTVGGNLSHARGVRQPSDTTRRLNKHIKAPAAGKIRCPPCLQLSRWSLNLQ